MIRNIILLGLSIILVSSAYAESVTRTPIITSSSTTSSTQSYISARNLFKTKLIHKIKAPQNYSTLPSDNNIKVVTYPSYNYNLKGLLNKTNIITGKKSPVLVYLHGGFTLDKFDMDVTKPFTDNGFVVFAPSYRGENGNAGNYELFMGEVDDAKSAVEWIAKQPFTDRRNIYVFGHSIGGGVSLNLSFFPDLPIKQSGSSAGLYSPENLLSWDTPFDITNENEFKFRVPLLNLDKMAKNHVIYMGNKDFHQMDILEKNSDYLNKQTKLNIQIIEGDHGSSLPTAMEAFIKQYYIP